LKLTLQVNRNLNCTSLSGIPREIARNPEKSRRYLQTLQTLNLKSNPKQPEQKISKSKQNSQQRLITKLKLQDSPLSK
jgi:hypothetical protein